MRLGTSASLDGALRAPRDLQLQAAEIRPIGV